MASFGVVVTDDFDGGVDGVGRDNFGSVFEAEAVAVASSRAAKVASLALRWICLRDDGIIIYLSYCGRGFGCSCAIR